MTVVRLRRPAVYDAIHAADLLATSFVLVEPSDFYLSEHRVSPAAAVVRRCIDANTSWTVLADLARFESRGASITLYSESDLYAFSEQCAQELRDFVRPLLVFERMFSAAYHHVRNTRSHTVAIGFAREKLLQLIRRATPNYVDIDIQQCNPRNQSEVVG